MGEGDDTAVLGDGNNEIFGGDGADVITVGDGDNGILTGVEVTSELPESVLQQTPEIFKERERGTSSTNVDSGTNVVTTGNGNNRVLGSLQKEGGAPLRHVVTTGDGEDRIEIFGGSGNVVKAGGGDDHVLGSLGDDEIFGEGGNDSLVGVSGNDVLDGGSGNDVLPAGRGSDKIIGGSGNDTAFDFEGEDSEEQGVESFELLESTDYVASGLFNFEAGKISEVVFRGVESVPSGQRLFANINSGAVEKGVPQIQVIDTKTPFDGFVAVDSSVRFKPAGEGEDESFAKVEIGEDGLPISQPDVLRAREEQTRRAVLALQFGNDSFSLERTRTVLAAHELVQVQQFVDAAAPIGSTRAVDEKGRMVLLDNIELDAVGLAFDIDGDGYADEESANRFDGGLGESENNVREDLGLPPKTSFSPRSLPDSGDRVPLFLGDQ